MQYTKSTYQNAPNQLLCYILQCPSYYCYILPRQVKNIFFSAQLFYKKNSNHKKSTTICNIALPATYIHVQPTSIVNIHTFTKQTKKPYTFATSTYGNTLIHNFTTAPYLRTSKLKSNLPGKLFYTQENSIIPHTNYSICICNYIAYTGIKKKVF